MLNKTWSRLAAVLVLTAMLMTLAGGIYAQEEGCFNLSAADCEIITAAEANMAEYSSFTYDLNLELSVGGLESLAMFAPELPGSLALTLASNGALDSEAVAAEVNFNFGMTVDEEAVEAAGVFALVDEVVYMTDAEGNAIGVVLDEADMAELGDLLNILETGDTGEGLSLDMLDTMFLGVSGDYVSYVRLDDVDLMGQTMYPFQLTVNLAGLINDPGFLNMVMALSGMGEDPEMAGMLQMLTPVLQSVESEFVYTLYVGADDMCVHKATVGFTFAIDLGVIFGTPGTPATLDLYLDVELDNINAVPAITAPANAKIVTEEEAQALLEEMFAPLEEFFNTLSGGM